MPSAKQQPSNIKHGSGIRANIKHMGTDFWPTPVHLEIIFFSNPSNSILKQKTVTESKIVR